MGYRSCTKRTACAAWRWGKSGRCRSLLFLCSLTALLDGNSTGIVREGLPLDFYNLLIDLFVFFSRRGRSTRQVSKNREASIPTRRDRSGQVVPPAHPGFLSASGDACAPGHKFIGSFCRPFAVFFS